MKRMKRRTVLAATVAGAAVASLPRGATAQAASGLGRITGTAVVVEDGTLIVQRGTRRMRFDTEGTFWDSEAASPDDFLGTDVVVEFADEVARRVSHLFRLTRGTIEARTTETFTVAGTPFALSPLSRVGVDGSTDWTLFDNLSAGQRVAVRHRRRPTDGTELAMQVTVLR